jgi:hypothetical protein
VRDLFRRSDLQAELAAAPYQRRTDAAEHVRSARSRPFGVRRVSRHARSTGSGQPAARRPRSPGLGPGHCEWRFAHPIWVVRPPLAAINSRI